MSWVLHSVTSAQKVLTVKKLLSTEIDWIWI